MAKASMCTTLSSARCRCLLQMLIAGWDIENLKVVLVPYNGKRCGKMLCLFSMLVQAAIHLPGKRLKLSSIGRHKEFAEPTRRQSDTCTELQRSNYQGRRQVMLVVK